jgi:hypothetical protein
VDAAAGTGAGSGPGFDDGGCGSGCSIVCSPVTGLGAPDAKGFCAMCGASEGVPKGFLGPWVEAGGGSDPAVVVVGDLPKGFCGGVAA